MLLNIILCGINGVNLETGSVMEQERYVNLLTFVVRNIFLNKTEQYKGLMLSTRI